GRPEDDAAVLLEDLRPDHEVRDPGLVFKRDEHDALCRSWPLAHKHDARGFKPLTVPRAHRLPAGDYPAPGKVLPQEKDWVAAQGKSRAAIVGDDLASFSHRPERHIRLVQLR